MPETIASEPESPPSPTAAGWEALALPQPLLDAVHHAGFQQPTEIQRVLVPVALAGKDCIGQARTGTGKTAAFTLPLLDKLTPGGGVQALVLVPTRELAIQVDDHVRLLAHHTPLKTVAVLGGRGIKQQLAALAQKPEIAIGTPGRVQDLMHRKALKLDVIRVVVLDEVDRMLDIGFRDDIRRILGAVHTEHQTIFVSATIDDEIRKLARSFMHDPVELNVSRDMLTVEGVTQGFVTVDPEDKAATLVRLLRHEKPTLAIVFTNTKHKARRVAQHLKREAIECREIHGDLEQERRERVMKAFRTQRTPVLVATDLAARGLDVTDISHIINYDVPVDSSVYVHRIGRTARMGRAGIAYTFDTRDVGKLLSQIEKHINKEIPRFEPAWLLAKPGPKPKEPPPEAAAPSDEPVVPRRYRDPRLRDQVLDALGYRPVKRTLGSRFRSARKRR